MSRSLICILFLLSIFKYERVFVQAHRVYNEVYKRDFSEHCRRKVVPSVFLGRKVVEATSEILQFSKLELPYSCSISVRSESGTNIILVIEVSSRNSLISSCTKDADQLLVYEMGETFGGYWGTLGERVMNQDIKNENKYYTIKTTPFSESIDSNIENNNEVIESTVPIERITTPPELSSANSVDYIEEEVPLVNVSGFLSPGVKHVIDIDSIFDQAYDVSLGSSISYDTTILPLVQFSEMNDFNARRNVDVSNIYSFPMDIKLIYPKPITSRKRKLYRKYKYNSNKLLNFKSNGNAFKSIPTLSNLHRFKNRQQLTTFSQHDYVIKRVHALTSKFLPTRFNTEKSIITRDLIDSILESFNKSSKSSSNEESPTSGDTSELLRKISEMKHNFSVYLSPNLSTSEEKSTVVSSQSDVTRIPTIDNISFYQLSTFSGSEMISLSKFTPPNLIIQNSSQAIGSISSGNLIETYFNDNLDTKSLHPINNETDSTMQVPDSEFINLKAEYNTKENIVVRDTYNYTELPVFNYTQPLRGSLVNRESWENVVQIAPVMADLLNVDNTNKSESMKTNNARRRKKHINSISINMAKPHRKISSKETGITTTGSYNNADMQDFLEMVELQDDEMQGRVALRYLRRYVGPVLFNVCNYEEALARHVYLFNSSRIILAISNFTIDKMALVVTPARTLLKSEDHCSSTQLECQVSGARVCIDSSTACDGTPNCGSYDIYDEDRLICGGATGLQHNVYLAAFTFLAVILTLMYTIYYWLKRCVPKVSDAFFIYTEGYENMLYLDSIMRSPNDDDENSKSMYQPNNAFDADLLCPVIHEESNTKLILKAIRRILVICTCFLYKGKKNDKSEDNIYSSFPKPKRTYSFTEQEIRKMLCNNLIETGIQTGDSLEMAPLKKSINNDEYITDDKYKKSYKLDKTDSLFPLNSSSLNTLVIRTQKNNPDELNVMKFLNNSRSSSLHLQSNTTLKVNTSNISSATPEEKEIQSHVYEQQNRSHGACSTGGVIVTNVDIHEEKASAIQSKHLRFEESATMIPADYYSDSDDRDSLGKNDHRRSVVLGTDKSWKIKRNDNKEEVHEQGSNSNKDYIRFWSKSKKSKKSHK